MRGRDRLRTLELHGHGGSESLESIPTSIVHDRRADRPSRERRACVRAVRRSLPRPRRAPCRASVHSMERGTQIHRWRRKSRDSRRTMQRRRVLWRLGSDRLQLGERALARLQNRADHFRSTLLRVRSLALRIGDRRNRGHPDLNRHEVAARSVPERRLRSAPDAPICSPFARPGRRRSALHVLCHPPAPSGRVTRVIRERGVRYHRCAWAAEPRWRRPARPVSCSTRSLQMGGIVGRGFADAQFQTRVSGYVHRSLSAMSTVTEPGR
jgi:hypothetical protein